MKSIILDTELEGEVIGAQEAVEVTTAPNPPQMPTVPIVEEEFYLGGWDIAPKPKKVKPKKLEIDLNEIQEYVTTNILENKDKTEQVISIEGFAGTGKSTITSNVVERLYESESYPTIAIITPTHQALKVIKNMIQRQLEMDDFDLEMSRRLYFKTLHSFLGLKHAIDDDGNEIFVNNEVDLRADIIYCDYLIVDESSMINHDMAMMLFELLSNRVRKQIIFIGDSYQIKPVNGQMNFIFNKRNPLVNRYELKQVVRQKEDSSITHFALWLIECINDNEQYNISKLMEFMTTPKPDIECFSDAGQFMKRYFEIETEDKIIGCYTNRLVQEYNTYIRYMNNINDYPDGIIPEYIPGEKIIFLKPYDKNGGIQYNNGDIVTIAEIKHKQTFDKQYEYWYCTDEDGLTFNILDSKYVKKYQEKLKQLADIASKEVGSKRRDAWAKFYDFKKKYAFVRPVFANTFHKLQGSTYDHVFINGDELIAFLRKDLDTVLRLIYVAITRGRQIYILKS